MKYQEIIYYTDELTDDFGNKPKKNHPLPKKYKYMTTSFLSRFFTSIIYQIMLQPLAYVYVKLRFHQKFKNKHALKEVKNGYFIYINHTALAADAFIPNILSFKKKNYIITGKQTSSMTLILPLLRSIGSLPLSDNMNQKKQLQKTIQTRFKQKSSITIYPEAHVWPYYTDIRPFTEESFKYAVKLNAPVFSVTNCYQKRKFRKKPKIVSYIDGPFYQKDELSINENAKYLRDTVYSTMKKRANTYSTYSYFKYEKVEKNK